MTGYYPWQQAQWRQLAGRLTRDSLPHALLLHGPAGTGKADFAVQLARALLCQQRESDGQACGACSACLLYAADNHPDSQLIEPEKEGGQIKIDQIRALITQMALSSHAGGYKVAIIRPAEAMTIAAANSLLKTLEEPPAQTLIMLVAEQLTRLPATVRSRCQLLHFNLPDEAVAQTWLAQKLTETGANAEQAPHLLTIANGAPLTALADVEKNLPELRQTLLKALAGLSEGRLDPVRVAGEWLKLEQPMPIKYLYGWVSDMIRYQQVAGSFADRVDYQKVLHSLSANIELQKLHTYLDRIAEALPLMTQLNPLPIIESLLVQWVNIPKYKTSTQD